MNRLWTVVILGLLFGSLGVGGAVAQEEGREKAEPQEETAEKPAADALAGWVTPAPVEHELEGRHACLTCHASGAEEAPVVPQNHVDRTDDTCMWCHSPEADVQTKRPVAVTHDIEKRSSCLMCHKTGAMDSPRVPASHAGRTNEWCTLCHRPGVKGDPQDEAEPEANEPGTKR